jgi:hypothetical protein
MLDGSPVLCLGRPMVRHFIICSLGKKVNHPFTVLYRPFRFFERPSVRLQLPLEKIKHKFIVNNVYKCTETKSVCQYFQGPLCTSRVLNSDLLILVQTWQMFTFAVKLQSVAPTKTRIRVYDEPKFDSTSSQHCCLIDWR